MSEMQPYDLKTEPPMFAQLAVHPDVRVLPSKRVVDYKTRGANQYLPTLFDRLMDDEPNTPSEDSKVFTQTNMQMKAILQRDLVFLLNTLNTGDLIDKTLFPEAAKSSINYGIPPMAGDFFADVTWQTLKDTIKTAIETFEPRFVDDTLTVLPVLRNGEARHYNVLQFEISGQVHMQHYPMEFAVQSAVDLETNRMTLR
jgi:type VI secretion system protein ImpF